MYNITDFGAERNSLCTKSIQRAIDKCAADGGGSVIIPGGMFISGTIYLRDNVDLRLESGAVLKASENMDDYNADDAYSQNWGSAAEKWRAKHLIIALECSNVSITGGGTIDGSADAFFADERIFPGGYAWNGGYVTSKDDEKLRPGQLICFIECSGVRVRDITAKNSPCWCVFLHGCSYAQISGIKIFNPFEYVNTDGIDIDCCRDVTVSDCIIKTGDDAIAVRCDSKRLKTPKICENITITNCSLASNSSVFRIGVGVGEIRRLRANNLIVSRAGSLITFSTSFGKSGRADIEDVCFSGISAYNTGCFIDCYAAEGSVKGAVMENMNISSAGGLFIAGDGGFISDISLKNIKLEIDKKKFKDEKYVINVKNADNVSLDNFSVSCNEDEWEEIFHHENSDNLKITACSF